MRSEFEKAYEPNPHKSPFSEVRFNEEKQIYEPLNPPLDRVARSLNAAWYGYRIRQTEVDELKLQVAEMKSRLNDAYTDGQSAMYTARQSKIDELQNNINLLTEALDIKEQLNQKLREREDELQKRVDAALTILSSKKKMYVDMFIELEQALKGGSDEAN